MKAKNERITVLLVDDYPLACAGICKILETAPDIAIVGKTHDAVGPKQERDFQ